MANGIDGILAFFEQHSVIGMMNLQPHAEWLIYMFAILDVSISLIFSLDTTKYTNVIQKFLRYGFFLTVIRNFQDIANMLFGTFATAGSVAASGTANAAVLTPGALWNIGFDMVGTIFSKIFLLNIFDNFGTVLLLLLAVGFCAISTFKMVLQFLEMKIEFCIFSSIAVFFIPFGCLSQLGFLFQRIVTGFFSSLSKIMVMYFMLALVHTELTSFSLNVDKVDLDIVNQTMRFFVMGLLVCHLPQFAANIMTGTNSGQMFSAAATGAAAGVATAIKTGSIGSAGYLAGATQQYHQRLAEGVTRNEALKGTGAAVMKDMVNAALGNPAGKIWFPAYDKGRSKTLRRANPFEDNPSAKHVEQSKSEKGTQ